MIRPETRSRTRWATNSETQQGFNLRQFGPIFKNLPGSLRLVATARRIGRRLLLEVTTMVTPETLLAGIEN